MFNNFENKHKDFKGKISNEIYTTLEFLYNLINEEYESESLQDNMELLKKIPVKENMSLADRKMKMSIYYIRWCSIIENLINKEENEKVIEYFIKSNCLQEMNSLGLGYYYDVKYKKHKESLYSVGYGKDSNWINWLQKQNVKENKIKENGVQLIFKACKEHINRGGHVRLKSLSKCFGVDLFKYMQLDENGNANLYIIKDAPVNFIKINDEQISLQEYMLSDDLFDINSKPQFCLDFSHPRNEKIDNYNRWLKKFLGGKQVISQEEFNKKKNECDIEDNSIELMYLFQYLKDEHTQIGKTAISSRISPIADKEVIASDTLWKIKEYDDDLKIESIEKEICYHFTFNLKEYCQLIYSYFKKYAIEKYNLKQNFEKNYESEIKLELKRIEKEILKLAEEQNKIKKDLKIQKERINKEEKKQHNDNYYINLWEKYYKIEKQCNDNDFYIEKFESYKIFLSNISIEQVVSEKIKLVFSFIDWNTETIPKFWDIKNIYQSKCKEEINDFINLYKCICKNVALKEEQYGK